jgi:hypothetical protein
MQNDPSSSSANLTYTLIVNGSPTALSVTIAGNVNTAQDTSNSVAVSQGDQIALRVTKAASISPAVGEIFATAEFV